MKFIGLEEHYWTAEIRSALKQLGPDERDDSLTMSHADAVEGQLLDLGASRLADMDRAGVDVAILSVTTPATQILPPDQAVALARQANDKLAAAIKANPTRLLGFATLPTPAPDVAVDELTRAVEELGFKGAMIHGRTGRKYIDHKDFRPILRQAAALGVPIYIHPQIAPRPVRELYYDGFGTDLDVVFAAAGWGWHLDAGINALRLVLAGVFDELPTLQIILGHWGEMIPFYIERADIMSLATHLDKPIKDYLRSNFYITPSGMHSDTYLRFASEVIGIDRIMFSTDYPFVYRPEQEARRFIENSGLSVVDQHKIAHGNAESLFNL